MLVDFWATWCAPCHIQARILAPLYDEFHSRGVEFLAVSVGEEEEIVREFVRRSPYPYPVLVDPRDEMTERLGIYVLPTLMIIDTEGRVAYFQPGIANAETLRDVLEGAGASAGAPRAS